MTALEQQLSASLAAQQHADEIELRIRDAIRHGACDLVAARFGANALEALHGDLSPATRATALVVYTKRAAQMRAEGAGVAS